jgi:hypothetical protein
MTIEFNCPKCNSVIAFTDKHAGKRAHCTTCGQSFVIPDKSHGKIEKIKPPKEILADPIPDFYYAALVKNWKTFINPRNITGFAFILAATVFMFFTSNLNFTMTLPSRSDRPFDIPIYLGWTCRGMAWGFLFWYYREIIYATAYEQESFPEVILGGFYSFLWKIIESIYTLFIIIIVVALPAIVIYFIFGDKVSENPVLLYSLILLGIFLLPAAIMNIAVGKDITLLRPDYLIMQIVRDFLPYFVIYILLAAAIMLQIFAKQYNPKEPSDAGFYLLLNCINQLVFVFAIRAIGIFFRHYSCHAQW